MLVKSLDETLRTVKKIGNKLFDPPGEVFDRLLRKFVTCRPEKLGAKLNQKDIDTLLAAVKEGNKTKELALEPYLHSLGWGVRVLHVIQQPAGMSPQVEVLFYFSNPELPDTYPRKRFWPRITSKENKAVLAYAEREPLHDMQYYEY